MTGGRNFDVFVFDVAHAIDSGFAVASEHFRVNGGRCGLAIRNWADSLYLDTGYLMSHE
jgi:hypothetical protein